ncbi:MAG: CHAT domain-containing protein [Kordia sp.]|uniref:CHAT domain-containing protein n=1 Tax=Kordia sp. TaxID=1965332 RepID=UPI003859504C
MTVDKIELAEIYYTLSKKDWKSNINRSLAFTNKIVIIADQVENNKEEVFVKALNNKVLFLSRNKEFGKAIQASEKYLNTYTHDQLRLAKMYRLRGNIYSKLGDLKKSNDNYDQSIYMFKNQHNLKELTKTYISKLDMYVILEDELYSDEINQIINQIELLEQNKYNFPAKERIAIDLNIGYFYEFSGNYKKARTSYLRALKISQEEEEFDIVYKTYINLGILSTVENDLINAKEYFNKASKYVFDDNLKLAPISNNLAEIYIKENNHEKALIHYQKAITQALHSKELDSQTLPSFQDIELSPNKIDILGYLIDKANGWIAYYEVENNPKHLQNALETFTLADKLVDIIYVESSEDLSKLFWRKKGATFYPKAVEVCYRLQQPEKAFLFMEKNKAILLLENITNAAAKRLSKLPENLLKREQNLIKEIKTLESEMQGYKTEKTQQIETLKNKMFDYKKEYNAFIDSLETNYPKYYKYKKNINTIKLKEVQKNLQKDELVLQYIVGKEKGFVALISSEKIQLQELPNTETLKKTVAKYKNAVSNPFVKTEDKTTYEKVAKQLYQQLIPFAEKEGLSQKQITIIADGMLQYIPFEALLTPTNEYLIQNAQIQYNYSLSSAAQSKQNNTPIPNHFIAIAPTKFKNEQYSTLATSSNELEKLTSIFGANHFQYEKATKQRFTKAYGNYKIVHLSTHGGIKNTVPWMAFYDEKMTLDELYFSKNQSELVVLSACKTSDGELKKGEGVMSLARGFFNAGAKSVISSLWNINEKASSEIIQEFYKNIVAGDTKSEALQKAKLSYIQNNKNTSEASPYYWSALTLTGDISPIGFTNNTYLYYMLGGFFLTGIIVFNRFKKNKKQAA